jgi:Tol biopolymer transport system component
MLHDVGHQDGTDFLVMEYLEGQTLAERLKKGALPLDQALQYAIQIAAALDAAHRRGIVHRDLKPSNIMLTKSGAKLLDFGIATIRPTSVKEGTAATKSEQPLTAEGTLIGTLHYMAPEQLEGREADARSDLFAFGAVLYEMLTGRRAFEGETDSRVIAAVLDSEPPPISASQPLTPPVLDHVVKRCLAKDPDERWQTAHDLTRQLQWIAQTIPDTVEAADSVRVRRGKRRWWAPLAIASSLLLSLASASLLLWKTTDEAKAIRFSINVPPMPVPYQLSISPDGRSIAFVASGPGGAPMLFVRHIDSLGAEPLPGTEGAFQPFWSPDSRYIGFGVLDSKLKKVAVLGGQPQNLCDLGSSLTGATWNSSGQIVFSAGGRLHRLPAAGGTPTQLDAVLGDFWPYFLPDSRHYLFLRRSGSVDTRGLYVGVLDSPEKKRLMPAESMAAYAPPGMLLFQQEGTLLAQPFDADRLELRGSPLRVAEGVLFNRGNGRGGFAVSDEGTLVYRTGGAGTRSREWLWMDRSGNSQGTLGSPHNVQNFRLSPDRTRVAFSEAIGDAKPDIWIYDSDRGVKTQLTADPAADHGPIWSADGSHVVFNSDRLRNAGNYAIYEKRSDGAVPERLLLSPPEGLSYAVHDWSQDGRFLIFSSGSAPVTNSKRDLWVLPTSGNQKPIPYPATSFSGNAALSPNGRWLAYTSDETGTHQIIVQSFPDPLKGKWTISRDGGVYPRWSPNGGELYYLDPGRRIVAVSLEATQHFKFRNATPLFGTSILFNVGTGLGVGNLQYPYDTTSDGNHFLVSSFVGSSSPSALTVVVNWADDLKQ